MEINKLISESPEVSKYIQNREKYDREIDGKTILNYIGVKDIPHLITSSVQTYLDDHDLQLSNETLLQAIKSSPYHKKLAEQFEAINEQQNNTNTNTNNQKPEKDNETAGYEFGS